MTPAPGGRGAKRILDLALALVALLPAALLCLPCMVAIRLESPGPAVFAQRRVGRGRREFTLLKLRTMAAATGDHASHEAPAGSVTRVGRFLRRTKLDELPQIVNVLKGEMSFVGPRPCLPGQTELIAEREARGVFALRPGITGPAQLAGIDMSTPRRLAEADAAYLRDRSLARDLRLILMTATGGGRGDAVRDA